MDGEHLNYHHEHCLLGTLATGEGVPLTQTDRRRHLYLIGKTGTGKSTLLFNLMMADFDCGRGFALLDPHGDLAQAVADAVPPSRTNDVLYFDLSYPVAFNPLERVLPDHRPLVAAHIVAAFKHLWGDSWGPRLEYILDNSLRLLLDAPGSTLLGLPRLLADPAYRSRLLTTCTDPIIRAFWQREFAAYHDRFLVEAVSPIQNKIGALLSPPAIRNIVGQQKSTMNIPHLMNSGKVLRGMCASALLPSAVWRQYYFQSDAFLGKVGLWGRARPYKGAKEGKRLDLLGNRLIGDRGEGKCRRSKRRIGKFVQGTRSLRVQALVVGSSYSSS